MASPEITAERVHGASDPKYRSADAPPPRARVHPDPSKGWFWRLWPLLAARRWLLIAALACGVLMIAAGVAFPRIVMSAIDLALADRSQSISKFAWILAALALVQGLGSVVFRYSAQKVSLLMEYDLRAGIYEHMQGLSFSFYDRAQTGQLISRANADIRAIQLFLAFAPLMGLTAVSFAGSLAVMLSISPLLTAIALIPIPGVYFAGMKMRGKLFPISWLLSARMAEVATIVEESVAGVRIVKSFAAEKHRIGLLAQAAERLRWVALKQVLIRSRFAPLMENLPRVGRALVLLAGGWMAIEGSLSIGALVAINMYFFGLQAPFMIIGFLVIMSERAAASSQRIYEIFDEASEIEDRQGAEDIEISRGRVEFDKVSFGYADGDDVLRGLDLKIEPGETLAVVGRTGCGKSTLMRLLPRFYDVRQGAVRIDGFDVRDVRVESLRREIGLVLDEPFLFSESIHDNIAYARPDATRYEVEEAARRADAHDFVCELEHGYDTVIGERGYTLSGGQRQRIAIARTLLANPRILVLDDATSSVDVKVEQQIHDALRNLFEGRTTLIIAHRLSTIALAERVVLLDQGRIVADGTHAELLRSVPAYAEILTREEAE
jgi:ATP-binding cassette subfamily B protein